MKIGIVLRQQKSRVLVFALLTGVIAGCATDSSNTVVPASDRSAPQGSYQTPSAAGVSNRSSQLSPAAESLLAEARGLMYQRQYQQALQRMERAQRISPKAPDVYLDMANVYRQVGEREKAERFGKKALSLSGDDRESRAKAERLLQDLKTPEALP